MALDRKSANARRNLQRHSPTFVQKREIFERLTCKSKALKVIIFLSRSTGAVFGLAVIIILLSSCLACHHHFTFNDLGKAVNPRDIPVVTVHDFTKFRIPPPLSFELEKISRIFPYPGAENVIHPLVFPDIFPWLARGPTPGGSR